VNTWQQTWKQLVASWNSFTTSQRTAYLGGCGLMLCVLGGVAWWSSRPDYATLVNRLSPTETAEVVSALEAEQIPYQLNFAASAVSVPKASLAQARLTIKDQLGLSPAEAEAGQEFDLFADPSQIHQRLLRQQESRLARSISQFRSIKSAVVHISRPATSTFLRDVTPATASVIVELKPGGQLTARDANAIVSLVSHGVEGLRAEDVSVMDTEGRLLTDSANSSGDVAGQLEYRRRFETELSSKAETMLGEMLGAGRSIVRVTADIDFTATETQQTTFDPDGKVKVSETTRSESTTGKPRASGGAGVSGNLPPTASSGTTESSTISKVEENETQYANAETKNTVRDAPGKIRRITVAAVVDLTPPEGADPAAANATTVTQADVERIVKQAVGFDLRRNDEVEVLVSKIATLPVQPAAVPSPIDWEHWVRTGSLGVGALVALLISWLALRRRQTALVTAPTESSAPLPVAMAHRVHQVSEQALRNPRAAAAVLQAWLKSESTGARTEALPARRRAA
jgi:flagellar M-ring protein FliF